MEPIEALERISYLLDRAGESVRRSTAYLRAADAIRGLPREELEKRHRSGRLTDFPGVGESTAKAIGEALDGAVPARLADLESAGAIDPGVGTDLRAAVKGDCHTHSTWSDGGASVETMAAAARALGHEYLVLTDHSPRLRIANGLSPERLRSQLDEVGALNERLAPFRVLTGIEVDILEDGTVDQEEELLARLDVVVASVHSKLAMERRAMTERMVRAAANPHVDILGHCTGRILPSALRDAAQRGEPIDEPVRSAAAPRGRQRGGGRPRSLFDAELVFAACARFDTAVEINCRVERQDPPDELLDLALDFGCMVSIDTDAHAPGQLEWISYGCE
jgi:putative hydrolase